MTERGHRRGRALLVALVAGCGTAPAPAWVERPAQPVAVVDGAPAVPGADPTQVAQAAAWQRAHDGVTGTSVAATKLGVLLPLTGPWAALGVELKAALELARDDVELRPELVFFDTAGDASQAAAAVDDAERAGVVAIIGPVGQREAQAAATRAAIVNLPIALLAPGDGAAADAGVFRMVESPADEARRAARLAADAGYLTVGVLTPRDDTGAEQADAFAATAAALGLQVTARGSYDPDAGALEVDLRAFLGLDPRTNPRLRKHLARHGARGWKTFSPDVPFGLLFVPDRFDHAAIVASFLPYLGVEVQTPMVADPETLLRKHGGHAPQLVQLVGDSGWNHPSLPLRGGPIVDGALIVDVFSADAGGPFAERYAARTGRSATSAAAQAYDAMHLVMAAWRAAQGAAAPRPAFTAALRQATVEEGACGAAEVGPDGEVRHDGVVLEVQGDMIGLAPW